MQQRDLVNADSDVSTEGVVVCITLLIFLVSRYVMTSVVRMHSMFCLMCESVQCICSC